MTAIVGVEFNGKVYMAGDLQGTGGNNKIIHTQPKLFNKKGVLFGFTTSYRFGQILDHLLPDPVVPENPEEVYRWLITVLIPDIKKAMKDAEWTTGGSCLIGVKGQLWELQNDWSVLRSVSGYAAVGAGTEYGNASMMTNLKIKPPKNGADVILILQNTMEVISQFCPSVGQEAFILES
jgi:ATP-dependent protease HslVU (ClpYQ) peptidase subunit